MEINQASSVFYAERHFLPAGYLSIGKKKNNNLKTRDEQTDTFVSLLQWLSWKRETCFQNCIFNFYDICY